MATDRVRRIAGRFIGLLLTVIFIALIARLIFGDLAERFGLRAGFFEGYWVCMAMAFWFPSTVRFRG